jgi:hypothetical protein
MKNKREPLRYRLAKTHTIAEIEKMISDIDNDPDSKVGATGLDIYNKSASKKLDEMTWAIYYISKKDKPEHIRQASSPEMKNW